MAAAMLGSGERLGMKADGQETKKKDEAEISSIFLKAPLVLTIAATRPANSDGFNEETEP